MINVGQQLKVKNAAMDDLQLALDKCLQQLTAGRWSLARCLAEYPEYAAELRPLLETAMRFQQGKALRPTGAMRDRARARLASHIQSHPRTGKAAMLPRVRVVLIATFFALLIAVSALAQAALPGQILYGLKLSTEFAWRAAAADPIKADLTLADRHAAELLTIASGNNSNGSAVVQMAWQANAESEGVAAYVDVLDRLDSETNTSNSGQILGMLMAHQARFSQAGIHVPRLDRMVSYAQSRRASGNPPGEPTPSRQP